VQLSNTAAAAVGGADKYLLLHWCQFLQLSSGCTQHPYLRLHTLAVPWLSYDTVVAGFPCINCVNTHNASVALEVHSLLSKHNASAASRRYDEIALTVP
jgi:hypothetical protein